MCNVFETLYRLLFHGDGSEWWACKCPSAPVLRGSPRLAPPHPAGTFISVLCSTLPSSIPSGRQWGEKMEGFLWVCTAIQVLTLWKGKCFTADLLFHVGALATGKSAVICSARTNSFRRARRAWAGWNYLVLSYFKTSIFFLISQFSLASENASAPFPPPHSPTRVIAIWKS